MRSGATSASGRGRSRLRQVLAWVEVAVLALVVGFWFFALRPQGLGGPASYALVSGTSMLPRYHTGDVVIVHRQSRYRVGDIVAYKVPKGQVGAGAEVIHRIVGGSESAGWIVQGDNRSAPDIWHPRHDLIVGRAWLHVPRAGIVIKLLHTPLFLGGLAALAAMLSVLLRKPKADRAQTPEPAPTEPAPTEPELPVVEPDPAPPAAAPLEPNPAAWPFWEFRVGPEHRYAEYELAPAYREPAADEELDESLRELALAVADYGRHLQSHTDVVKNLAATTGDLRGTTGELREFLAALTELLERIARDQQ